MYSVTYRSSLHVSSSEKVRNGPDYFGGMGAGVLGCYGYIIAIYPHITIPPI